MRHTSRSTLVLQALLLCIVLASCGETSGEPKVAGRWYTQSQVDKGSKLYAQYCITCHNENARGTFSWRMAGVDGSYPPPPLNGTAHAWHHPLNVLKGVIEQGGIPMGGKMPGFGSVLNEGDELAIISYFQSFWSKEIYGEWLNRGGLK
jgi:mono/diheme cytochrome c family protein